MKDQQFELPSKIDTLLGTLNRLYQRQGNHHLQDIVVNASVSTYEGWDYDNWDGGIHGHAVTLTLGEELYLEILDQKDTYANEICKDLNQLANVRSEHISTVFIEMEPSGGDQWRESSGVLRPRATAPPVASDALERIWGSGHIRVFISHKANVKVEAADIKGWLRNCGISAFVAHEDIEPTEEWQREIERALFSMDALVALLTSDFHESKWTDQEVGVGIGRGVPLIPIRLGLDPYGLMGKAQALLGCSFSDTRAMAANIFSILQKRMPDQSRLFQAALDGYSRSTSFADSAWKVEGLFGKFQSLSAQQIEEVLRVFHANFQNRSSWRGRHLLCGLLSTWTGEKWEYRDEKLVKVETARPVNDDLPF